MPDPERHILVDHTCPDFIPQHLLHVTEVWFDQHAIRIEYIITLPLTHIDHEAHVTPSNWEWHAVDDLGNSYTDCGGAYGLSEDGQRTHGVLSLQPLPPPEARLLKIVLALSFWSESTGTKWKTSECTFEVALAAGSS